MRVLSFLLFVFVISGPVPRAFSQSSHSICVSGRVVAERDTTLPIVSAVLRFSADNGSMFQTKTDSAGLYKFAIKKVSFNRFEITVLTDRETRPVKQGSEFNYLAPATKRVFTVQDSVRNYTADFKLPRTPAGCYFPGILFKKNSVDYYYEHWLDTIEPGFYPDPGNALDIMTSTLKENPSLMIEIATHGSPDEKNPTGLSQKRAECIKQEFIKRGIAPARLIAKGYGIEKPLVKAETIAAVIQETDKEKWMLRNRRCIFKIVGWDYKTE